MTIDPSAAAGAYSSAARLAGNALTGKTQAPAGGDSGAFSDLVLKAVGSVADTGEAAEAKAAEIAEGKTDVVDLVTAVAETEVALETLVTVRDRVISAYQDILNMPI
jgi:flagellar hook-basal body complex protein FliE